MRCADLRDAQDALLRQRLAKTTTIDGAFSALSALLRDAVDVELIDANPAARLRVRAADPRLDPKRGPVKPRTVPPAEIRAFIAEVDERHRGVCWAPVATGCRPGELFAFHHAEVDQKRQMIYLHETVDRYGHLMPGLKGTHHIPDREDSRLLSAGIPVVEVSAWMGHTIRAGGHEVANTTTRVYAHPTGESRTKALRVLVELMRPPRTQRRKGAAN